MKQFALILSLYLCVFTTLMAEEFVIRKADHLSLEEFSFQAVDGSWMLFFSDYSSSSKDVYCHKLSASGEPVFSAAKALTNRDVDQILLSVIPTSDGNFIFMWEEPDIANSFYLQKVNTDGECLWPSEGVEIFYESVYLRTYRLLANNIGGVMVVCQHIWNTPIIAQNYDSYGNALWGDDGLVLLDVNEDEHIVLHNVISDAADGFILYFIINPNTDNHYQLLRFSEAGELVDQHSILPIELFEGGSPEIIGPVNGQYLLYYIDRLFVQINKMDANGQILLDENLEFSHPVGTYFTNNAWQIKLLSDGRVVYTFFDLGFESYRLYMLSSALELLWEIELESSYFNPYYTQIQICESLDGKICFALKSNANLSVYLIDATGAILFNEAKIISADAPIHFLALVSNDVGIFVWDCEQDAKWKIKLQCMNFDGTYAHDSGGFVLEERFVGNASALWGYRLNQSYALGDRYLILWNDTRSGNGLYYQLVDQSMQPILEPNGRAVPLEGDLILPLMQSIVSPDNKLYFIYKTKGNYIPHLQTIDYNGNLGFEDCGIQLTNTENYVIDWVNNFVYLAWIKHCSGRTSKIMAQKYINGQPQWGNEGKVLVNNKANHFYQLLDFKNGYLVYSELNHSTKATYCKAIRFDIFGYPYPAWDFDEIYISSENIHPQTPLYSVGLMGDDLVVILQMENVGSLNSYLLQRINAQAQKLWGAQGAGIVIQNQDVNITNAIIREEALLFLARGNAGYTYHCLDGLGNFQTPEAGIDIIPADYAPRDLTFACFDDGSSICAFSSSKNSAYIGKDIYICKIGKDGTSMANSPVLLCAARNEQIVPSISTISHTAIVTWIDQRLGWNFAEIWANSVNCDTFIDEPVQASITKSQILGNYPNPFNPSTTISYSTSEDGVVRLCIYNIKGQLVNTLVNEPKCKGKHQITWQGKDSKNNSVSSGIYFVRMISNGKSFVHKLLLMK